MFTFPSFINFSRSEIALFWCSEWINVFNKSAIKNSLIISLNDEKSLFFIDNLASANPSIGEELNGQSFLIDVIHLIIASSVKDKILGDPLSYKGTK